MAAKQHEVFYSTSPDLEAQFLRRLTQALGVWQSRRVDPHRMLDNMQTWAEISEIDADLRSARALVRRAGETNDAAEAAAGIYEVTGDSWDYEVAQRLGKNTEKGILHAKGLHYLVLALARRGDPNAARSVAETACFRSLPLVSLYEITRDPADSEPALGEINMNTTEGQIDGLIRLWVIEKNPRHLKAALETYGHLNIWDGNAAERMRLMDELARCCGQSRNGPINKAALALIQKDKDDARRAVARFMLALGADQACKCSESIVALREAFTQASRLCPMQTEAMSALLVKRELAHGNDEMAYTIALGMRSLNLRAASLCDCYRHMKRVSVLQSAIETYDAEEMLTNGDKLEINMTVSRAWLEIVNTILDVDGDCDRAREFAINIPMASTCAMAFTAIYRKKLALAKTTAAVAA